MKFFVTGKIAERKDNKPPVLIQGEDDNRVARVRIYSRKKFIKEDSSDKYNYYDLTAFGKTIDWIINNCPVGTAVEVTGRIEDNNYTKQDGVKVYSKQYIIENIAFCPSSSVPQQTQQQMQQQTQQQMQQQMPQQMPQQTQQQMPQQAQQQMPQQMPQQTQQQMPQTTESSGGFTPDLPWK